MLVDLGRNDLGRVCEYGSVEVDELMVGRDLLARAPHRQPGLGDAARGRQRDGRAALGACRPARSRARPKVRAMQIIDELEPHQARLLRRRDRLPLLDRRPRHRDPHPHRRRQGRQSTCRPAAAPSPTPSPPTSTTSRSTRRRRSSAPSSWPASSRTGHEQRSSSSTTTTRFTYNLVQYLGELGAEVEVVRNDKADGRRAARARRRPARRLARALHAGRGRDLDRGVARLRRGRHPVARRLPRPPVAGRGVRRRTVAAASRSTARTPRSSTTARPSTPGLPSPLRRRPLPLADRRPRPARRARAHAPASATS